MKWKNGVITLSIAGLLIFGMITLSEGVNAKQPNHDNNDQIKVFVGQTLDPDQSVKDIYKEERNKVLKDQKKYNPNKKNNAVVTFNSFMTIEETQELIDNYPGIKLEEVWLSIPGQDGRGSAVVKNNNVQKAIDNFMESTKIIAQKDSNAKKDYEEIASGNFGIFAVSIEAKNTVLNDLSENQDIKLVDIHYDPKSIDKAQKEGKKVIYIDLPEKPDGTH